ncbi:hypothetical protein GCM10010464_35770 [Pseudonocardia yunnanensis]
MLWPTVGVLVLLSAVLAAFTARASPSESDGPRTVLTAGAQSAVSESGPAIGSVSATTGSVVIVAPQGPVTVPMPAPPPASQLGRLVVGELPGTPPGFLDRPELPELEAAFADGDRVAVVCSLTGARGVGKTQLAAAYARRAAEQGCPLVAWVSAETPGACIVGFAEVAHKLGLADPEGDSAVSAANLREHLQTRPDPAVLVIDNAVDADDVRPWLPAVGTTRVIITSTDRAFTRLGAAVEVSVFTREQSLAYLRERTELDDDAGAAAVADELGDLPVALAQAASVVTLDRLDYSTYLERLRALPVTEMLPRRAGDAYSKGVAEAILLSLEAAIRAVDSGDDGLTKDVMTAMAVLSPTGVQRDVLYAIAAPDGGAAEHARVDRMLGRLAALSLLVWAEAGASVVMHNLVGRVVRENAATNGTLTAAIDHVADALERLLIPRREAWAHRELGTQLVPHILALWRVGLGPAVPPTDLPVGLVIWAVQHMTEIADLSQATQVGVQIVADCERVLGPDHPDTLASCNNLASAYASAGRLEEALPLFEATLADRERVLGPDHPATLASRNNLASVYESAGRLEEATSLFEAVVPECERVLGPDHPDTLASRNNLASVYESAGRLDEAFPLFEATLADCERVLGPDHPDTLASRINLGRVYASAGRLYEAISLYEAVAPECERALGPDHPATLASRNNLASVYESAGRLDEALSLYEATLADRERVLGPDHPDTLTSRNNLAYTYASAGRLEEALPLYEATLADRERVLGPDHPDTLTSRDNLASVYESAGRLDEALPLFEASLADRERVLGPDHPATLASRNYLASVYESAGRLDEALSLYEATLADRERVLGPDHPDTLASRNNLAYTYASAGRLEEALPLYEATLADRERVLGPDHPDTLTSRDNLAYTYASAGRLEEALPLFEASLADRERVLGCDHPTTRVLRDNLRGARGDGPAP